MVGGSDEAQNFDGEDDGTGGNASVVSNSNTEKSVTQRIPAIYMWIAGQGRCEAKEGVHRDAVRRADNGSPETQAAVTADVVRHSQSGTAGQCVAEGGDRRECKRVTRCATYAGRKGRRAVCSKS